MSYNKINKPVKHKIVTTKKHYKIHDVDYIVNFNNFMEYDEIKKQLATITNLIED